MQSIAPTTTSATFIVAADNLDPDMVTRSLGMFPDQAWRRGEHPTVRTQSGRSISMPSVAVYGVWKRFLPESIEREHLEVQLAHWIEALEPRKEQIRGLVDAGHAPTIDIYFSAVEPAAVSLTSDQLLAFGLLGIDIAFNIYPGE